MCDHHRETDPERLVLRLCRDLLAQCRMTAGPSPLKILGSIRGVRRYHVQPISPASGCSGILVPRDGGYEITVNSTEPTERQNFSIAHEIIHTFFRDVAPYATPSVAEEVLCDLGAAELTMPLDRFGASLTAVGLSLDGIEQCSHEFAVSFEAAARRAVTTTDQPACILIAALSRSRRQERLDTGQPVLRITKWWRSRSWPDKKSYTSLAVAPSSLIGQTFIDLGKRQAITRLGVAFHTRAYNLQAKGYAYPLPGNPAHKQVVTLAQLG